jgi:sortase A
VTLLVRADGGIQSPRKRAHYWGNVAAPARTSLTLAALLFIGLAAVVRPKPKEEEPRRRLPLDDWVERSDNVVPAPAEGGPRKRPRSARLGKILIVLGLLLLAYSGAVVFWGDPATGLYARWKQHQLAGQLNDEFSAYASTVKLTPPVEEKALPPTEQEIADYERLAVAAAANKLNRHLKMSKPLGRITIPKIGVHAVFVQGTRWGPDLSQGPGHYPQSSLPGVGRTMAIAAHRTTFGAWFRHIDSLKHGDRVTIRLPYATFYYRVFGHTIVRSDKWRVIRDRGFDALVLSACHPLYSASHRWIVFARLYRVDPVKGTPYAVDRRNRVRLLSS